MALDRTRNAISRAAHFDIDDMFSKMSSDDMDRYWQEFNRHQDKRNAERADADMEKQRLQELEGARKALADAEGAKRKASADMARAGTDANARAQAQQAYMAADEAIRKANETIAQTESPEAYRRQQALNRAEQASREQSAKDPETQDPDAKGKEAGGETQASNAGSEGQADGEGGSSESTTTTKTTTTSSGGGANIGGALADTAAIALTGGKDPSGKTEQQRRQAEMHDIQSGQESMNEQSYMHEANRNARTEAGKDAEGKAATKNETKVNNMGAVSAGAAALERGVEDADVQGMRNYQAQQRDKGVDAQREKWGARQTAAQERGQANEGDYLFNQQQQYNVQSDRLSRGAMNGSSSEETTTTTNTQTQEETPKEQVQEETTPQEENPPQDEPPALGDFVPQHVINGLLGSSKGEDLRQGNAEAKGDADAYNYVIQHFGVRPITKAEHSNDNDPLTYENDFVRINGQKGKEAIQWLRTARSGGDAANAGKNYINKGGQYTSDDRSRTAMTMSAQVPGAKDVESDARVKHIRGTRCIDGSYLPVVD